MKHFVALAVVAAALAVPMVHARQTTVTREAVAAADRWLLLSDAADPGASWDQAAPAFRAAVTRPGWTDALKAARQPFGAVLSRKLISAEPKASLPGAPDGEYVLIQYDTRFAQKEHAVETVVPMRDKDGSWKVSGYFVK